MVLTMILAPKFQKALLLH